MMLEIGSSDFNLAIPSLPPEELELLSSRLFDEWEQTVERFLNLPDYSIHLIVEDGSVKGTGKIAAAFGVIYLAIGNYGDFIQGVKTISEQSMSAVELLSEQARTSFSCPIESATSRKRAGALGEIGRLYSKVQKGELSAEEAADRTKKILGPELWETPSLVEEIEKAFLNCTRAPHQQGFEFMSESLDTLLAGTSDKRPRQPGTPKPVLPPTNHLVVEVWRESKQNRKQTKVRTK